MVERRRAVGVFTHPPAERVARTERVGARFVQLGRSAVEVVRVEPEQIGRGRPQPSRRPTALRVAVDALRKTRPAEYTTSAAAAAVYAATIREGKAPDISRLVFEAIEAPRLSNQVEDGG